MIGKHTEEAQKIKQLEETVAAKDINESNDYGDSSVKRRKISELCIDTRYELLIDEIDGFYQKEKAQIIKLPITDQSHR